MSGKWPRLIARCADFARDIHRRRRADAGRLFRVNQNIAPPA